MTPCWLRNSGAGWHKGWIIGVANQSNEEKVLVCYDDNPPPGWGMPSGSMAIKAAYLHEVRVRREVIYEST